ncbi:zinc finger protein [Saccharothrix sp. BKS2]|uniref:zinc finger protein n=1 Tax=Saccharothrix sp. BKS2 TaxID=3064400 RepID=UPI0039EA7677
MVGVGVMGIRPFRWLPHDGRRHAIPDQLAAHEEGQTLCGVAVTVPHLPLPRCPDWCWPTCMTCDRAWRAHEGIPIYKQKVT